MNGFLYWPYDEVTIEANPNRSEILVKTPWIEAKVKGPIEPQANFELLYQKIKSNQLNGNDLSLVNWFFKNFENYPLCYILPVPKDQSASDLHAIRGTSLHEATMENILLTALAIDTSRTSEENAKITTETLANLPRNQFEWDIDAALGFAKAETGTHPESALSIARRYHLMELLENDKGKEVFKWVESLPKEEFAAVASRIVKQNLYVTEECQRSLTPALNIAQSARSTIEHFIQQERGHDRLLGAAMNSMVKDPSAVPVSTQTIALMCLLRLCAMKNFLGFAMAVDYFERSSYEKSDPLAQLLTKGGFQEAAKQINRHMDINDSGGHENMGLQFLSNMAPCESNYAKEAFRLAELVSIVMNSVTRSTIKIPLA